VRRFGPIAVVACLAGCASPGQVRRVETQVAVLRAETARQDSARAAELARIIRLQQSVLDSLNQTRVALRTLDAKVGNDLTEVQRRLVETQELVGQSQRRLSELRTDLANRADQQQAAAAATPPVRTDSGAVATTPVSPPPAAAVSADQMYQNALQLFRRNSVVTARGTWLEFLGTYPTHPLVPDAIYYIGETFESTAPDSALVRYQEVLTRFPQSPRAPTALYKIGLIAERRKDVATAKATYQRVLQEYPRSEVAELARDRLAKLKP
jgi:tol-pal system protein YbgF